jgi:hypothetical protein
VRIENHVSSKTTLLPRQVLILSERLHSVTAMFDRMRAAHFEEILQESKPARREGLPARIQRPLPQPAPSGPGRGTEEDSEHGDRQATQVQEYDETRALQVGKGPFMTGSPGAADRRSNAWFRNLRDVPIGRQCLRGTARWSQS